MAGTSQDPHYVLLAVNGHHIQSWAKFHRVKKAGFFEKYFRFVFSDSTLLCMVRDPKGKDFATTTGVNVYEHSDWIKQVQKIFIPI